MLFLTDVYECGKNNVREGTSRGQKCTCAGGEEYLWYRAPKKIDVAILRGTTADVDGNVTFEKEAMLADCLNQVQGDMCSCSL